MQRAPIREIRQKRRANGSLVNAGGTSVHGLYYRPGERRRKSPCDSVFQKVRGSSPLKSLKPSPGPGAFTSTAAAASGAKSTPDCAGGQLSAMGASLHHYSILSLHEPYEQPRDLAASAATPGTTSLHYIWQPESEK